ncbi:porin family protein [uncultured Alistipes sp.]|uniref:porin family protein n=1 Tax=uncultured Alistipes sp. TaxID=538949 RepID=UPI0025E8B842|nr:porin family protein [uncultured Alistipes sp.]
MCPGCSPQIATNIQKSYPARIEGSTVLVYDITDTLPASAELLGDIRIKDTGFSTECNYDQVMNLAKERTNRIGGNGLHLTSHKKPTAFGSSCHQIEANMLLIPDSVYTASYFDNIASQSDNQYAGSYTVKTPKSETVSSGTVYKTPHNTLIVNAGYAFITSKMEAVAGSANDLKQGLDINAAYQWTAKSGLGVGLRYSGYFASTDVGYGTKLKLGLHYIAPEFVISQRVGRRWIFRESVGIGYARYTESVSSLSAGINGFGFHVDLGFEYRLSQVVGIGASIGAYSMRFNSADDIMQQYNRDEKAGISRISLNGGLRFYF